METTLFDADLLKALQELHPVLNMKIAVPVQAELSSRCGGERPAITELRNSRGLSNARFQSVGIGASASPDRREVREFRRFFKTQLGRVTRT